MANGYAVKSDDPGFISQDNSGSGSGWYDRIIGKGYDKAVAKIHTSDKAYEEKKPFSEWYEYFIGPTGYDKKKGISYWGSNPGGTAIEGLVKGEDASSRMDWSKMLSGGKQGGEMGSNWGPWGAVIGSAIGGGAGATFVGEDKEYNSGLAASFRGDAEDSGYSDMNWMKYIKDIISMYGGAKGGGSSYGTRQAGKASSVGKLSGRYSNFSNFMGS